MRQIRTVSSEGYVTEVWLQAEETEEPIGYPELGEYEIATPLPDGIWEPVRWSGEEWVSEITEAELYEMAYREKHRELVQAATEEFVAAKPGYELEDRILQVLFDLYSMVTTGASAGMAGEANELSNVFHTLYGKLVALDQARSRKDVEALTWKS